MKGSLVLLERGDLLVRTTYTSQTSVAWTDGERTIADLNSQGFQVRENNLVRAINLLNDMHDRFSWGGRPTNQEFIAVRKLIEDY